VFQSFTPRTQRRLLLEQARAHFEASRVIQTEGDVYPGTFSLIEQKLEVSLSGALAQGRFLGFPSEEAPAPATLRGCVRDAAGVPKAGVEVGYGLPERGFAASVVTDENGRFELADVAPGDWTLRAGGGDHGLARELVSLAPGEERSWNPLLDRGDEVSGRILLENGDPLPELEVELWSLGSTRVWSDVTRTGADGSFAFPNVAAGPLELHVYTTGKHDTPHALPTLVVTPVFGRSDLGDLRLRPRELVSGALSVRVLDAGGAPLPEGEVRVWQMSTGRGCFAGQADEEGRFELLGLPLGPYRVEVGGALGWRDLGTVWLDKASAEGTLDLGEERFAREGTLLLDGDLDQEDGGATLSLWRAYSAVFALVPAELTGDEACLLAPGEYFLSAVVRSQRCDLPFVVTPEGASSFSVLAAEKGAPRITPAGN
jgi:protocatechuate 3,4-dioxygenase beta subunit